jgi:hypothetical protein
MNQVIEYFDRISEAPDAIPRLRRFILDLAVRGKLVEQDPKEASASEFLRNRVLLLVPDEQLWHIPESWAWSSLRCLGESIGGGTPSKANSEFWGGTIPWVSPKDMKADFVRDSQDHISEEALRHSAAQLIPSGAVLMVIRGMILAHSFPVAISQIALAINQDMKAMIPFRENLADILLVLLKGMTPAILRLVQRSTHGTCRLSTDELFDLPIPIPPLEEQRRMVARVDELQALCDRLEAAQAERERRRDWLVATSFESVGGHEVDGCAALNLLGTPRFTIRREHIPKLRRLIQTLAIRGRLVAQDSDGESGAELLKRVQDAKLQLVSRELFARKRSFLQLRKANGPFLFQTPGHGRESALVRC